MRPFFRLSSTFQTNRKNGERQRKRRIKLPNVTIENSHSTLMSLWLCASSCVHFSGRRKNRSSNNGTEPSESSRNEINKLESVVCTHWTVTSRTLSPFRIRQYLFFSRLFFFSHYLFRGRRTQKNDLHIFAHTMLAHCRLWLQSLCFFFVFLFHIFIQFFFRRDSYVVFV